MAILNIVALINSVEILSTPTDFEYSNHKYTHVLAHPKQEYRRVEMWLIIAAYQQFVNNSKEVLIDRFNIYIKSTSMNFFCVERCLTFLQNLCESFDRL